MHSEHQVRIIDSCLRLHGQLCPPEMLEFHATLEKFFHKNFHEELQRLSFEIPTERGTISSLRLPDASYAPSLVDATSIIPSSSSASTTRAAFAIPPLHLPGSHITPPQSPIASFAGSITQPTRLQKHIAHLARHGMNAVASGPGESIGTSVPPRSDSISVGSAPGSFVNVTGNAGPSAGNSGASLLGSKSGSLKGRFSRFGSFSFGRREGRG
jgi:dedicator of cytokinesis protein 3